MPDLVVKPCSHAAAKHAVLNWHYSQAMPSGKLIRYGAWEDGRFVGAIIYGRGATPELGSPYGLDQTEVCELARVAFRAHEAPVTQMVAVSLRDLRIGNPGLRLVVSFADPNEGHHGGIYQAGNWVYTGAMVHKDYFVVRGRVMHPRSVGAAGWSQSLPWLREHVDPNASTTPRPGKHRYVYPLDRAMRRQVAMLAKPYPTADEVSTVRHPASGGEGQVRPLPSAPHADDRAD